MSNYSVCGIDCDACKFKADGKCASCRISAAAGKCVWGGRCNFHDCAIGQNLEHCGKCAQFPCQKLINLHKSENPNGNGIEIENLKRLS